MTTTRGGNCVATTTVLRMTCYRNLALFWLCLSLASALLGQSDSLTTISSSPPSLQPDEATDSFGTDGPTTLATLSTTTSSSTDELTSLPPSTTERTSNAIPELAPEQPKKHSGLKKPEPEQLDKPYPYLKKSNPAPEDKDNAIRQAKRSGGRDSLALNGTLQLSIGQRIDDVTSGSTTTLASSTSGSSTEATLSTVEEEETTTTEQLGDETTIATVPTTTPGSTEPATSSESSGQTESAAPSPAATLALSTSTSSTSTTSAATASLAPSTVDNAASTSLATESPSVLTTLAIEEQPSTTPVQEEEQEHSTLTTLGVTEPPEVATTSSSSTTTTTEPTIVYAASTRISATTATTTPLLPVTTPPTTSITTSATTSTTTTTTTTTTAKPSTGVSPKIITTTSVGPDTFSPAVTTGQDDSLETTTTTTSTIEPVLSTPAPEDVTLLVRIVLEGSWQDVCSKLPILRQSLTDLLNSSLDKLVSARQIIFHQTQCSENLTPTSLVSDKPLTSLLVYTVDDSGKFDAKHTRILPSLYESSPIDFPLKIVSVTLVGAEADSGNAIAVVIVSCVAFICLILLAGLLFIMRKRQGRFNYGERCRPVSLDAYSLDSVSAYNSVRRSKAVLRSSKRSYGNPAFEDSSVTPTHPLNFAGLSTFCNDASAVAEEFAGIPQIHSKIEELPPGAELKNRYANVIPLPETRVPLQRINNDPLSEYINASYVRGPKNATKYYIACQAPTEATVADFWRMIWEQQCKVLIMLTDLVENGVDKCTEYIPPLEVSDCHRLYGDFQVTLKKREAKEKYAISTLHLKNLENNTFREVSHIWYLWPASGVPADAAGLIAVLLEARALQRGAAGPILVHCSPGTGRTGTLIALDLCIRQYEVTRTVDVPRVVYTIRRDRAGAVQTREQYIFIYKGLNLYASKLAGGGIDST